MATIKSFEEIEAWNRARALSIELFQILKNGHAKTDFALRDQVNRSIGSVMDNIAEGFDRSGTKEFISFLIIAKASNAETRSQLYRTMDRNYISPETFAELKEKNEFLGNKIMAFLKYLKASEFKGQRYR